MPAMQRRQLVAHVTDQDLVVKATDLKSGDVIDNDPRRDGRYPSHSVVQGIAQSHDKKSTAIYFRGITQIVPADREYHISRTTITYEPFIGPLQPAPRGYR